MEPVILVIHLILALSIIGLVLIQRSEGGGLGIGGGGGGLGNLATAKGTANALTRATAICAGLFFCTSIILGILATQKTAGSRSLLDDIKSETSAVTAPVEGAAEGIKNAVEEAANTAVQNTEKEADSPSVPSAPIAE